MASFKHFSDQQRELLPHAVDRLARERPDEPYGLWPVAPASYEAGFRTISYAQLANMVNGLAWWIEKHLGTDRDARQVLTYMGPNDVRLTAMVLASVKAGYALFLTSPRNSPAAQKSLLASLKSTTLVTTTPTPPPAQILLDTHEPRLLHLSIPSIDELLAEQHPLFEYGKSFDEGRWDPLFILHSSGSTGMPKVKIFTQESGARHIAGSMQDQAIQPGATSIEKYLWGKRVMMTMPPFHGAGLAFYLFWAIPFGVVPIAPAAVGIVTAQGLAEALEQTPAEVAFLVPSVVVELAQDPALLARCARHLRFVLYAGGDLPQALGDRVAAAVELRCWYGASECGLPHQLVPPGLGPGDWNYLRFHPSVGASFEPVAGGAYELVMRRDDDRPQTAFSIRGQEDVDHYRSNDLFTPHPTVPDAWRWRGRADDIIVFSNGEKTNPVAMEQHVVVQNPEVASAVVVGTRRFQPALLIELAAGVVGDNDSGASQGGLLDTARQADLIERIWPSIQEANRVAPAFARVDKALVLILPTDRPLIRAGKGTIQRAASIAQYAAEIDALYDHADVVDDKGDDGDPSREAPVALTDVESVRRFIRDSVDKVTDGFGSKTEAVQTDSTEETFFDRGMDSLMALQLIRILRRGLHRPDLGLSTIYSNPTVSQLQAAITSGPEWDAHEDSDAKLMEPFLKTYSELIQHLRGEPEASASANSRHEASVRDGPTTVVLTGSTGTIGTFLLRALLSNPKVKHIFCLNRSRDGGRAAQEARLAASGLGGSDLDQRVTFLHADLSQPLLGLDDATYKDLQTRLGDQAQGAIIHNAWPVNFNLGLAAFQPQLAGLVNLFRLATSEDHTTPARFFFISSVSAVGSAAEESGKPVPEEIFTSHDTPFPNGYARSKFLSEILCDRAARALGIPTTVVRVGQVAGAVRGGGGSGRGSEWNRAEWLPTLILGSRALGCVPDSLGPRFSEIDWVPSDVLADVLVDLLLGGAGPSDASPGTAPENARAGARVFHLRNPRTTTWDSLLPAVVGAPEVRFGASPPAVVTPSAWLERLSDSGRCGGSAAANPALKLLDFYRTGLWGTAGSERPIVQPMEIKNSLSESATLRDVQAVSPEWMLKWIGEWIRSPAAGGINKSS